MRLILHVGRDDTAKLLTVIGLTTKHADWFKVFSPTSTALLQVVGRKAKAKLMSKDTP